MTAKILAILGLASAGLLLVIMTTTTPESAGALGIFSVFLLTYIVLVALMTFVLWIVEKILNSFFRKLGIMQKRSTVNLKIAYYYASIISLGLLIVFNLQTAGGVSMNELALVVIFVVLGSIYVARRTA